MNREELHNLGLSKWDRLRDAIDSGNWEKALSLLNSLRDGVGRLGDANIDWIDMLLTLLAEKEGEEAVYLITKAHDLRFRRRLWKGVSADVFYADVEERLRTLCNILTIAHGLAVDVSEDEEKFVLSFACDTGGRLIARGDCGKTEQGYPWSHGEEGFCYYCSHCVISWEMAMIDSHGYPAWIPLPPKQPGERCTILMYKDPVNIPEKYYSMLGKTKKKEF